MHEPPAILPSRRGASFSMTKRGPPLSPEHASIPDCFEDKIARPSEFRKSSSTRKSGNAAPRGISVVGLEGDGKPYPSADTGVRSFNQRPNSAVVARREKVTSPTP